MVSKQETISSQWAQVQNAYQRRADLIPNLVATVQGYAQHEQETFNEVTAARSKATSITLNADSLSPDKIAQFQQAQDALSQSLGKLLMVREAYPDLKANQNFLALQDELAGTENRISVERNKFNTAVQDYNSYIRQFPRVIYAGWFGFESKGYFEAAPEAQTAPKVQF
jgi:LemA protein